MITNNESPFPIVCADADPTVHSDGNQDQGEGISGQDESHSRKRLKIDSGMNGCVLHIYVCSYVLFIYSIIWSFLWLLDRINMFNMHSMCNI